MALPVLMLDFDGTICVGDAPVRSYVEHLATADPALRDSMLTRLAAFLAEPDADPALVDAQDAYQAVQRMAEDQGLTVDEVNAAYRASRQGLLDGHLDVRAPEGLADLLARLSGVAQRVVVTNAPLDGLERILSLTGLDGLLDEVVPDAGKPVRTGAVVESLLAEHGLVETPAYLMSVGDIWANDLAAPLARGCAVAYVDPLGRDQGPAHARGTRFEDVISEIEEWAADPAGFVRARAKSARAHRAVIP